MCNLICEVLLQSAPQASQLKGFPTIQMFYANPAPPPTPHIDRCSGPTKPIRFASSPPDCLFTSCAEREKGPAKFWAQKRDYVHAFQIKSENQINMTIFML